MNKILIYGTLKEGHYNHYLLESTKAKLIEKNVKLQDYQMKSFGSFPCIKQLKDHFIIGDLYEINDEGLQTLDDLEIPYGYCREIVNITIKEEKIKCYVYSFLSQKTFNFLTPVKTGIWE